MVGRPSRRLGDHTLEPQRSQVQLVDEDVDHPDRVLLGDVLLQVFRKQDPLPAILALDEALHRHPHRHVDDAG